MKKLSILFLFIPFVAMGQIWPTDVQYQFLNGIYAGNYGNLHITSDGDIDTIKGSAYDWPDSIRVADAGKRYYLTGVYSGGQYDMDWRRPSKADVSDLVENQFVFGGSDGSISQSEYVLFDNGMYAGFGAGIRIRNESSPMVLPSWAMLRLEALEGNAEIQLQAGSIAKSGIRFFNWTGNTQWYVHMDESENFLIQNLSVHPDDFRVNAATLRFTENELGEHTFFMNGGGFEIQNNDNAAVLTFDQNGTEYTVSNTGSSLDISADTTKIDGDVMLTGLSGTGSRLAIDDDGNITRTANSSTYQITLVAADQVNASSNEIIGITGGNFATVAQASRRQVNMTHDGSFTFASVGLATTQPATGDLVLTLYKNGSATSMVLTIPASSALGSYITTTETVTFVEGDYFYWYATNGASTNSGLLNSVSLLTHYTP